MKKSSNHQSGFTLVEILVALVIILIMVMALVPMYELVAKTISSNKSKEVATGLANSTLEEMRSLPFIVINEVTGQMETDPSVKQLGIQNGNPPGSIPAEQTRTINGITYTIKTRINWVTQNGNPTAYKKVKVSIESPSAFKGNVTITSDFHTLAAEEGERTMPESGHIRVHIRDKDGNVLASPEIAVHIESNFSPSINQTNYTENGETLFGVIKAGIYTVSATLPANMVTTPDQQVIHDVITLDEDVEVVAWNTTDVYFDIDHASKINLTMTDTDTSDTIQGNGILNLKWTMDGTTFVSLPMITFDEDNFTGNHLSSAKIGNLWPGGNYSISLSDVMDSTTFKVYYPYDMETATEKPQLNNNPWNGSLGNAGSTINLNINLKSALKTHLTAAADNVETELVPNNPPDGGSTNQVTKWNDLSGYEHHAAPDANRPVLVDDIVNGHSVIRFSGLEVLKLNDYPSYQSTPYDNFTIFVVVKADEEHEIDIQSDNGTDGVSGQKYLFWPNWGGTSNAGQGLSLGTNGISSYEHGDGYMPATAVYEEAINGFNLIGINYEDKKALIYLNGSNIQTGISSPRTHIYAPTDIGGGSYGNFKGDIAEILIYDSSLNSANTDLVSHHLLSKYNLP